jgi:hypothetical protein
MMRFLAAAFTLFRLAVGAASFAAAPSFLFAPT